MLFAYNDFVTKGCALERLVGDKFGSAAASSFRTGMFKPIDDILDGVLLWIGPDGRANAEVKVVEEGNVAHMEVLGRSIGITAARHHSNWLLSFTSDRMSAGSLDGYRRMLEAAMMAFEYMIRGIHGGAITAKNIHPILSGTKAPPGLLGPCR